MCESGTDQILGPTGQQILVGHVPVVQGQEIFGVIDGTVGQRRRLRE